MPLITLAIAAHVAGLLSGFSGFATGVALITLATLAIAVARRDARAAGLAGMTLAGAVAALGASRSQTRCRSAAEHAHAWRVVLQDAAAPGAFVPATISQSHCTTRASLSVQHGVAPPGAEVSVAGEVIATSRGITIQHARIIAVGPHRAILPAMRAVVGSRIDAIFRADAPLVRALLIADTRSLDPALRDRFAAAGIVHMLSISGLHVAIIAGAIELLAVAARLPRRGAAIVTLAITAGYIALIGAPPPAVRSGIMLGVTSLSRLTQRPTSPWAALALGGAAPIMAPYTVLEIGWQLSVLGMASLIASGALARRWIASRWSGWQGALARVALASTVASAVSAPLVTWSFGRLSLVAPLTNIVATPIIAVLQPTLFLATLCAPMPPLARFVADAAHPLLAAFDAVATIGANIPHGALTVAPTLHGAMLAGLATAALLIACVSDLPARPLIAAGAALTAAVWLPLAPHRSGAVELHVIDVGQGDAIALRTPRGRWILVDAGRTWRGGDAGRATVIPYLRRLGGDVALFVLSHPHADHAGGAPSILHALHPGAYWDGAYAGTSDAYRESLLAARADAVCWRRVHPGDSLDIDGVHLEVLAPDSAWMSSLSDPNEASVVVLARYGAVRFLLVGDAERGEEQWLLDRSPDALRADVLKVGHHGSVTSSTDPFLDAVRPRVAVVSVGAGNSYGHPSPGVLRALARRGAVVLRTDQVGSIVIRTNGRSMEIEEGGEKWPISPASSPP